MAKPSIAKLDPAEKKLRWKQHQESQTNGTRASYVKNKSAIVTAGVKVSGNDYLKSILDPSSVKAKMGVPDEAHEKTYKMQLNTVINMPFDDSGRAVAVIQPTAKGLIVVNAGEAGNDSFLGTPDSYVTKQFTCVITDADDNTLVSSHPVISKEMEEGWIARSTDPYVTNNNYASFPSARPSGSKRNVNLPHRYKDPTKGHLQAQPAPGTSTDTWVLNTDVRMQATTSVVLADTASVLRCIVEHYDKDGVTMGTSALNLSRIEQYASTGAAATNTSFIGFSNNFSADDIANIYSDAAYFCIVGYQTVGSAWTGSIVNVTEAIFWRAEDGAVYPSFALPSCTFDASDYSTTTSSPFPDFTQVRCVSMSALASYFGNALAGGQIASALVSTSKDPMDAVYGITDYGRLSVREGAHNGAINKGTYVFWKPNNIAEAKRWTGPFQDDRHYRQPYIVISAVATEDGAKALRLKVTINLEAITERTIYNRSVSLYNPNLINDAFLALAYVEPAGENETHQEKIEKFLSGVWNNRVGIANAIPLPAAQLVGKVLGQLPNWG